MVIRERTKMEKKKTRQGFGHALLELGRKDPNVTVVTADVGGSVNVGYFAEEFPERFINVGVAEQNMANIAAGMSLAGKTAFYATYGCFATARCLDMIRTTICYANLNVKIAGSHGGLMTGEDGASHQALEEIGLMRILPNMKVLVPCDYNEAKKATFAAAATPGPVYLRLGRASIPVITGEHDEFVLGKGVVHRDGGDVAIVACGVMVFEALLAAEMLAADGIDARVINLHTVKPIDRSLLSRAASECGAVVTAEEHQIHCGLGSAVAEVLVTEHPVPMEFVGMNDSFGISGPGEEVLTHFGLRDNSIAEAARRAIQRKK